MKPVLILLALVCSLAISGCSNDTDSGTPAATFAISYMVEATGSNATVTLVRYVNSAGDNVSEVDPALPWSATASRAAGETATLFVTGTTGATSTITGRIQDDPNVVSTPTTYAEQSCPADTDPCSIDISNDFQ